MQIRMLGEEGGKDVNGMQEHGDDVFLKKIESHLLTQVTPPSEFTMARAHWVACCLLHVGGRVYSSSNQVRFGIFCVGQVRHMTFGWFLGSCTAHLPNESLSLEVLQAKRAWLSQTLFA